jgi:RimJ/RimL family protein N-acetyltransferase
MRRDRITLPRIVAMTRVRNTASQHVLEKVGMTFEGEGSAYGFPVRRYQIDRATRRVRHKRAGA